MPGDHTADGGEGRGDAGSTEARIIGATLQLIGEQGLSSVTMSAIAAAAGVSRQTLYNHYPDAGTIVAAAAQRHNRDAIAMLESSMSVVSSPEDRLAQVVRHVVGVAAHAGHALEIQHALALAVRQGLAGHDDAIRLHIGRIIDEGVSIGDFRADLDPRIDGALVQGALDGAAGLARTDPGHASDISDTARRSILAMLVES